jgi:hypothetical protein
MISGIAITLADDDSRDVSACAALTAIAGLTLGARVGRRLAAVLDVSSAKDADRLWDDMRAIPGVTHIDCVCVLGTEGTFDPVNTGEA